MVLKPTLYCDRCGRKCKYDSISLVTGTQTGVDGSEDAWDSIDLCLMCSRAFLVEMLRDLKPVEAKRWLEAARNPKVKRV